MPRLDGVHMTFAGSSQRERWDLPFIASELGKNLTPTERCSGRNLANLLNSLRKRPRVAVQSSKQQGVSADDHVQVDCSQVLKSRNLVLEYDGGRELLRSYHKLLSDICYACLLQL